jgi:hypothetical protein
MQPYSLNPRPARWRRGTHAGMGARLHLQTAAALGPSKRRRNGGGRLRLAVAVQLRPRQARTGWHGGRTAVGSMPSCAALQGLWQAGHRPVRRPTTSHGQSRRGQAEWPGHAREGGEGRPGYGGRGSVGTRPAAGCSHRHLMPISTRRSSGGDRGGQRPGKAGALAHGRARGGAKPAASVPGQGSNLIEAKGAEVILRQSALRALWLSQAARSVPRTPAVAQQPPGGAGGAAVQRRRVERAGFGQGCLCAARLGAITGCCAGGWAYKWLKNRRQMERGAIGGGRRGPVQHAPRRGCGGCGGRGAGSKGRRGSGQRRPRPHQKFTLGRP